jgi:tRNA-specific 2-thiouridylase
MSAPTTIVGLSGGVDSAVAALLLARSGAPIAGLFMQNWEDDEPGACRADEDRRDALAVAVRLGIPFHPRNFARDYRDKVFAGFIAEHEAGRTPNPDVLCNREIKFKVFLEHALELGASHIATGHYARIAHDGSRHRLLKAADSSKDQSYFLHLLGQHELAHTLFPVGEHDKTVVRRLAHEAGFAVHAKRDSTGICFIGERDFAAFLGRYVDSQPGDIVTPEGRRIGTHRGIAFHTLGQRGGLGIGGSREGSGEAWFVVGKDCARNLLIVDQGAASPHLLSRHTRTARAHWIAGAPPAASFEAHAKTRYRQPDQACTVSVRDDGTLDVRFAEAQRAVTPGQSLVLYAGLECLGGAVIEATDATYGEIA